MKVWIGLGNPGRKYAYTRHNIGFMVIDQLADQLAIPVQKKRCHGLLGDGFVGSEKVMLFKPQTYMNRSGEAVAALIDYFNVSLEDVIVIYDDLDVPLGRLKLRMKGSAGGHNGIKSIVSHLHTTEFQRMRLGIGRPENGDIVSYVLQPFSGTEQEIVDDVLDKASKAAQAFITERFSNVMNIYNA